MIASGQQRQGALGEHAQHLPKWPHCSPLPNPSLCDQTLGPLTLDQHLIKNTIPLLSAYQCCASTPIKIPDTLNIGPYIPKWISIKDCWLAPPPYQNDVSIMYLKTPTLGHKCTGKPPARINPQTK